MMGVVREYLKFSARSLRLESILSPLISWRKVCWGLSDELYEKEIKLIQQYAPNINEKTIVDGWGQSPLDVSRHLPNMQNGDWMCGALSADQFLDKRPFPECSQYRTPVEGLYVAGSSCHPADPALASGVQKTVNLEGLAHRLGRRLGSNPCI